MHVHTIQLNIEKLIGGTAHMDATEFGAYMSLIVAAYQTHNKLPADDRRLSRMARVSGHKWHKIKHVILEKFELKDGFYEQNFVKKDLLKMKSLSKKNRANALKKKETPKPVGEPKKSQTGANTNNNNQVTISISKDIESSPLQGNSILMSDGTFLSHDGFCELCWQGYPSVGRGKGHKGKFFEQVKRHLKKGTVHETIIKGITEYAEYCQATGELNADAFRWARDKGWESDYTVSQTAVRPQQGVRTGNPDGDIRSLIDDAEKAKEMLG